jgi:hypothetical protein
MIPRQSPIGSAQSQAKLAALKDINTNALGNNTATALYERHYAISNEDRRDRRNRFLTASAMQEMDDALSLSTPSHSVHSPLHGTPIDQPESSHGKRMVIDDSHEEVFKRRKQMQIQLVSDSLIGRCVRIKADNNLKDDQTTATSTAVQGSDQQVALQGRSAVVLPLPADPLARFGTENNNTIHESRDTISGQGDVTHTISPDESQALLDKHLEKSFRRDAYGDNAPAASGTTGIDGNSDQDHGPGEFHGANRESGTRESLQDAVTSALSAMVQPEPAEDAIVVRTNAQAQLAGTRSVPGTLSETPRDEPRTLQASPDP